MVSAALAGETITDRPAHSIEEGDYSRIRVSLPSVDQRRCSVGLFSAVIKVSIAKRIWNAVRARRAGRY
jgi:hypothetical protein